MRTLGDIIAAIKRGERPDYEELRYAVCALEALTTFDGVAIRKLAEAEKDGKRKILTRSAVWQMEEQFRRMKTAFGKAPKDWIGWENDPDNPHYRARVRLWLGLLDRVVGEGRSSQNGN